MALHKDFPGFPCAILDPAIRWFPADEAMCDSSFEKLMPPLVPQPHNAVKVVNIFGYDPIRLMEIPV
jgi:type III restriction enzyme